MVKKMRKQLKKMLMTMGVLCMMALAVCGCGRGTSADVENSQETESVSGKIMKLGDMQLTVKADNKVVKEDGTIESKGSGHKVTVLYDDETLFYICTIYGDGSSYDEVDAAVGDMEEGMRVEIEGNYEGKKLHAKQVQLLKFE